MLIFFELMIEKHSFRWCNC